MKMKLRYLTLKILTIVFIATVSTISAKGDYSVHDISGTATAVSVASSRTLKKGMSLQQYEKIKVPAGSKVWVLNSVTGEIMEATEGETQVIDLFLGGRRSSTFADINKRANFGRSKIETVATYVEGSVKRSIKAYDPEGAQYAADPRQLCLHVVEFIKNGKTMQPEAEGLIINKEDISGNALSMKVENTTTSPIYINVIKTVEVDNCVSAALSEIGQPTGCYVLLPQQTLTRSHKGNLSNNENQIVVVTPYQFDIDELLENVNQLLKESVVITPDTSFPAIITLLN